MFRKYLWQRLAHIAQRDPRLAAEMLDDQMERLYNDVALTLPRETLYWHAEPGAQNILGQAMYAHYDRHPTGTIYNYRERLVLRNAYIIGVGLADREEVGDMGTTWAVPLVEFNTILEDPTNERPTIDNSTPVAFKQYPYGKYLVQAGEKVTMFLDVGTPSSRTIQASMMLAYTGED